MNESGASMQEQSLLFTDRAAAKVYELIQEEDPNLKLRVFVTGGGCSGFQYGFEFVESPGEMDMVIEKAVAGEEAPSPAAVGSDSANDGADYSSDATVNGHPGKVQFLVDPVSLQYLSGAEIDYKEDVSGAQFVIRNPNAKTKCGCGSSFAV
jgi:iron-sulfur cluster insertion protein